MFDTDNLLSLYFAVDRSFWAMGVAPRLVLFATLYIVWIGSKQPGWRILSGAFSLLFLLSGVLTLGSEGVVVVLAFSSLVLAVAFGIAAYRDDAQWEVAPREGGGLYLLVGLYLFAFEFPFWGGNSLLFCLFFPPFGLIPHQALLVVLVCLMMSGKGAPLYVSLTSMVLGVVISLMDLLAGGNMIMGVTMLLYTLGAVARVGFDFAAGFEVPVKNDSPKPRSVVSQKAEVKKVVREKKERPVEKIVKKSGAKKKKKWDIN